MGSSRSFGLAAVLAAAIVLTLSLCLAACGGGLKAPPPTIMPYQSLDDALAELEALETPEGVDEALF